MNGIPFILDQINPLRRLDVTELTFRIDQGERGYYALLQWTYRAIEKKDPIARAVKRRLLAALSGLDWNVKVADTGDDTEKKQIAEKQEADLRAAYEQITNLRAALTFLALADLRGFSHVEKIYAGAIGADADDPWTVVELRIVEQWFWCRNGYYGAWAYNQGAIETNRGDVVDPAHYVIHSVDDPADEIIAELAVKKRGNDADWDGFLEDYGIPPQFFVLPPNVPKEREAEYQRAAELAISAARGSVPHGTDLLTPKAMGAGGTGVFSERLKFIDEQIVIAGTAGKLTVLSEAGSGTLAGSAQKEAFDEIAQAIANNVATRMHEQFDKPFFARTHPGEPILAYFEFAQINVKDTSAVLTDAATAATAGYKMDEEELAEKSGYKLTYVGLPGAQTPPPNKSEEKTPNGASASPKTISNAPGGRVPPADAVGSVAQALQVAPAFVAPGKAIIDELIAKASDNSISVDELTSAAEDLLKTVPELDATADLDSVIDALTTAVQRAAEATLAGSEPDRQ